MFYIAMTRQEAEWITSDDHTIKHYGTQAVLLKVQQESAKFLSSIS